MARGQDADTRLSCSHCELIACQRNEPRARSEISAKGCLLTQDYKMRKPISL